ncbi:hypothetical protein EV702DRAFT_1180815 [Suillus placidus]|uniref:CxC1-like cysteine cluster associated with KDZ transposases domain-containing protein n=1 Tax=Suillus placidus TaxID=48579 RepID=A0A9P7CZ21_9AGAM|nr:hypothetical protein EV702DRAFT_1180815 [Suillus placidus]
MDGCSWMKGDESARIYASLSAGRSRATSARRGKVSPHVAIAVDSMGNHAASLCSAYHQTHRVCPTFSFQAQCKTLCFLHDIPYRPYLTTQLSAAFDVYVEILHRVEQRLCAALKRNTPHWRLLNSCPACFHVLEDEPKLEFNWLVSIDGNNSLKRWDSTIYGTSARLDSRKARSDFWIEPGTVDKFNGEAVPEEHTNWEDDPAAETNPGSFSCADRWKNTGPEVRKKMFSVFDELGIFIAVCRHRFVLLACDMIRSGELSKYLLAILDKLLTVYGKNGACAYDIGCAFTKTLGNSSLGPRVHQLGFRLMVGAFHGHAHNRKCQLDWHPVYIPGTGHSEGEGCEHVFSASNALARGTRHASKFHWHQTIEQHFAFWNNDKYAALSNFLWNHYREALKSVQILTAELTAIKDFPRYLEEEHAYLDSLKQLPARDQICIRYVEALDELAERRLVLFCYINVSNLKILGPIGTQHVKQPIMPSLASLLAAWRRFIKHSPKLASHAEALVAHVEIQLVVDARWEIGGPEYNQFKMEARLGKYRTALNELERLVVMRLFELSKLSLSGTGYKLCQQISKALQRRSEAIRNAINRYNIQAVALNPPRPKISWKDIADYSFIGEFDLLRHSRTDIWTNDWAKPAHCEATTKYFKLHQAHEEVTRLNVEIRRLCTAMHTEEIQTTAVIQDLLISDQTLAHELQHHWCSRAAINAVHTYRLNSVTQNVDDIGAIISSDYTDMDAIDCEEHDTTTEDMADFLHSIID